MRHQSTHRKAFNIKLNSFIFVIKELLILAAFGCGLYFLINKDFNLLKLTLLSIFIVWSLLSIIFISSQEKCVCSLCRTSPLDKKRHCSKHTNAKRWGLSYRWPVIFGILIKGFYTCPYCGEVFKTYARPIKDIEETSKKDIKTTIIKQKKRLKKAIERKPKHKPPQSSNF